MKKIGLLDFSNYQKYEIYYQEMAEKGWFIEKIGWGGLHIFKEGLPAKRIYRFDVFEEERNYTAFSPEDGQEYRSMFQEAGWKYHFSHKFLNLFSHETGQSKFVFMDEEIKKEFLKKATKNQLLFYGFQTLYVLYFILSYLRGKSVFGLFSKGGVGGGIYLTFLIFLCLFFFFLSLESSLFLYKNKDSFESEENLYFLDPYWGKLSSILLFLTIVLFFFVNMAEMAMGHGLFLVFTIIFAIFLHSFERDTIVKVKRDTKISYKKKKWKVVFFSFLIHFGWILAILILVILGIFL